MKHVYFLKYNNYANRIFKREQSLQDYLGVDSGNVIAEIKKCTMWNPNDGITTNIPTPQNVNFSTEPDYCIATDEYGNIDSRWFVTETIRLLSGQYECHLKRDVFADAWEELLEAKCHIDRAILLNNDPLTFNPEPISVNRILHSEHLIKDSTNVPWIVFYSAEKLTGTTAFDPFKHTFDFTTTDSATWKSSREVNFLPGDVSSIQINVGWATYSGQEVTDRGRLRLIPNGLNQNGSATVQELYAHFVPFVTDPAGIDYAGALTAFKNQFTLKSEETAQEYLALDGKVLYDSVQNKYYRISTGTTTSAVYSANGIAESATMTWATNTIRTKTTFPSNQAVVPNNIVVVYQYATVQITLTQIVFPDAVDFKVPTLSVMPSDAPYYMWCMPYGKISMTVTESGSTKTVDADPELNFAIANWFANKNTENKTFDVQILPYCPLPDEYIQSGAIVIPDNNQDITDLGTIVLNSDNTAVKGFIFACPKCSFTKRIIRQFYPYYPSYKVSDICNVDRLYSPNYGASFEFSPARNGGIKGFNVRCTYMPIQPYIRIAPIWGGIYGNQGGYYGDIEYDKDPRGLICSGNYSIARLNDQWASFQEQNKNFEAIFDREINHMDVQRKYERAGQIAGAIAGTVTGAAAGAVAGSMAGPGAIAGGVIGAVGAAVTGAVDLAHSEMLFKESKSYATDIHFLQLGNVQALPRSLAKTTAFNVDNRYFPILAVYLPTEREAALVDEFINNRSMNVDAFGKPIDYIYNRYKMYGATYTDRGFISGSIIKIDSVHDTHFVDELNQEFQKGVYLR